MATANESELSHAAAHKVDTKRKQREDEIKQRIKKAIALEERKAKGEHVRGSPQEEKITAAFDKIFGLIFGKCEGVKKFLRFDRTQKLVCVYGTFTAIFCALLCGIVVGTVVGVYSIQGKNLPDVTQLLILCVLPVLMLIMNFMVYAYYKHDDDDGPWCPACKKNSKSTKDKCNCVVVWCKLVVFVSMLIAEFAVCLLPLDVANRSGLVGCGDWNKACGGLDFAVVWQILFWSLGALGIFIIPASISLYESQPVDPEDHLPCLERIKGRFKRVWFAVTAQALFAVLVLVLFFLLTNLVGKVELPLDIVEQSANMNAELAYSATARFLASETSVALTFTNTKPLMMVAPFSLYMIFICSLMGWVLFILYGGIGLWTLPIDLIMACVNRPQFPTDDKDGIGAHIVKVKMDADLKIQALNDMGSSLKNNAKKVGLNPKSYAACRKEMKELQAGVLELEKTYDDVAVLLDWKNHNPFIPYISLVAGIFSFIMSALWVFQICIYVIPTYLGKAGVPSPLNANAPLTAPWGGLASIFGYWDYFFPLGGSLHAMVHIFYLFICVWKGNIKFGLRFCGCMEVHPWKKGHTPTNAMLVNILLVIMTAFPIVQFSSMAFGEWARLTDIGVIFANTIENIQYFNILYRYNILTAVFLAVSTIALVVEPIMIVTRKRCGDAKADQDRSVAMTDLSKGAGKSARSSSSAGGRDD